MSDEINYNFVEVAEAIKLVKKSYVKGVGHYIHAGVFGYTQLPDENGDARGYELGGLIPVSQKVALDYLAGISKGYIEKQVKVKIGVSKNCIFIG